MPDFKLAQLANRWDLFLINTLNEIVGKIDSMQIDDCLQPLELPNAIVGEIDDGKLSEAF